MRRWHPFVSKRLTYFHARDLSTGAIHSIFIRGWRLNSPLSSSHAGRLILVGREGARRRSDASAPTSSLRDTRPGQPNTPTTQSGPAGAGADADSTGNGGESDAALDNRNDSSAQDGVGAGALRDAAKDGADAVPEEGSPDQVQPNEADSRIPLKQM